MRVFIDSALTVYSQRDSVCVRSPEAKLGQAEEHGLDAKEYR